MGIARMTAGPREIVLPTAEEEAVRARNFSSPILRLKEPALGVEMLGYSWQGFSGTDVRVTVIYVDSFSTPVLELTTWKDSPRGPTSELDALRITALEFIGSQDSSVRAIEPFEHDLFAKKVDKLTPETVTLAVNDDKFTAIRVVWGRISIYALKVDGVSLSIGSQVDLVNNFGLVSR